MKRSIKNTVLYLLLAVSTSFCSTPQLSKKEKALTLLNDIKVDRYVYENGLKVIVLEDHSSPTFAYQTWFNVGSKDEVKNYTGLAHLFEHMMFKQTKKYGPGEFDKMLEQAGAEGMNAFTGKDYTAYIQELPNDKLDLIIKLESERMHNLIVDEQAFKTETEVVHNERRFRNENNPAGLMSNALYETVFDKSTYHWPIIGYAEDLDRMNSTDADAFYKKFYVPNNATIVVVGDVDTKDVLSKIQKYYGDIPRGPEINRSYFEEPKQTHARKKTLKLNIQIQKLLIAFKVPPINSDDTSAIEVFQGILSEGKSSRLHKALVETGIASGVSSGAYQHHLESIYVISAELQKGRYAATAEKIILREINRLSQSLVSQSELEKAKNLMNFAFFQSLTTASSMANFLGRYETTTGDFINGIKLNYEKTQSITSQDIKNVVRKYFNPNQRSVIVGVPK